MMNIYTKLSICRVKYLEIKDRKVYLNEPIDEEKINKIILNAKTGRLLYSEKFIQKLVIKLGIKLQSNTRVEIKIVVYLHKLI